VAYGEDVFVAVGYDGKAAWSDDGGKTWTAANNDLPSAGAYSVAYGEGVFVTVCAETAAWSEDGKTWIPAAVAPATVVPANANWAGVAYGAGVFVAIDHGLGPSNHAAWSDDGGQTWTTVKTLPIDAAWKGVAYGDGVFVTVGSLSRGGTVRAMSDDWGQSWTPLPGSTVHNQIIAYGER
jgi:hypothetical protein